MIPQVDEPLIWRRRAPSGEVEETPFFFGAPGRRKFGVWHPPRPGSVAGDPILVIHSHFEEKLWAHGVLRDFACRAADRGHAVMRFDYGGHGDSEGDFESFGFEDLEEDANEACEWLASRSGGDVVAVGLRFGGLLAGRMAARRGSRVALWEPVVRPEAWLYDVLRANLTFQLTQHGKVITNRNALVRDLEGGATVHVEGYGLTSAFYRGAVRSGGLTGEAFPGRCTEVLAVAVQRRPPAEDAPLSSSVREWASRTRVTYHHVDDEPFWSDVRRYRCRSASLADVTLDWIEGRAAVGVEA